MDSIIGLRTVPANREDVVQLKSPPLPFSNASVHRLVVVSKNEVNVVLTLLLLLSLWSLLPSSSLLLKSPPSLPGMHLTTGWLLCQKMRSSLFLPLVSSLLSSFTAVIVIVFVVVVSFVIIIKITPPPCQECIRPQVGCCVKK